RRWLGAGTAYALWLIPLAASAATFLPDRSASIAIPLASPFKTAAYAAIDAANFHVPVARAMASGGTFRTDLAPSLLLAIWLVGAASCLMLMLWRQSRSLRLLGRLGPADRDGIRRADFPGVGPAIVGVLNPRVVLPADFESQFDAIERALILAHERRHIATGDTRINTAIAALTCLNWFNPLAHVATRLIRRDQELACDAAVIAAHPDARRAYGEALLKTQISAAALPLGCYWPMRSPALLRERITMLSAQSTSRRRRRAGAILIAGAVATAGLLAWATPQKQDFHIDSASGAPHDGTLWPLNEGQLVCDSWPSIWGNDPFGHASQTMPVVVTFKDALISRIDISGADGAFPHPLYPTGLALGNGGSSRMAPDAASYRVVSKTLMDTFSFGGLDGDRPSVTWQRIRLASDGPHESFLEGHCRKT
ncbi:MAG: M56 family metallopeptidase, partial [Alphaproteobacteria bacterium]